MNNIFSFACGYVKDWCDAKKYTADTRPKKYAGKICLSLQDGNDYIYNHIRDGKPFMAARYGANELSIVKWTVAQKLGITKNFSEQLMHLICNNAGFFPKEQEMVFKFGELMIEKSKNLDLLGLFYWGMEEWIVKNFASQAALVRARGLEPWYVETPWSRALEGKKVLVIHPFEDTILKQYEKREFLFPDKPILPQFELKTLKAVQTIAGEKDNRFKDWFEALQYMYESALKIDFDIAIIGCGAYGFPLAAMLKEAGKSAIHLGAATQYLFGIISKRAESNPIISSHFNDYWVRPSDSEKPKKADSIEGGCYW